MLLSQILFLILCVFVFRYAIIGFNNIYENIQLGRKTDDQHFNPALGFRNMLLVAFGQKKMFDRVLPAVLHFFIYTAFIITQFDLAEQFIDGIFGKHRSLSGILGGFYPFMISFIEVLSVGAFVATIVFLSRRNLLKLPRFNSSDLKGWASMDANLILLGEIMLIVGIFCLNGADKTLESQYPDKYHATGFFAFTSWLGPLLFSGIPEYWLQFISGFGWWLHIFVVFGFLIYLPYSKHLHILLAFPNTYFAKQEPRGKMDNIESIQAEVNNMLGIQSTLGEVIPTNADFGSHDIFQLTQLNLLNAYTCTECGRCSSVCPANLTGKKLSPRKIMMDVRDRIEEVSQKMKNPDQYINTQQETDNPYGFNDQKDLFSYISKEEIRACTTCNACVEACPVLINPLDIILQLRRYEVLTESAGPPDWTPMYNSLENSGTPWQMTDSRDAWALSANE